MDKSWINKQRNSKAYLDGVANFIRFATEKSSNRGKIVCPCRKCCNCSSHIPEVVEEHLVWKGFSLGYTDWVFHGESFISSSSEAAQHAPSITDYTNVQQEIMGQENMRGLLQDAFGFSNAILNSDSIVDEEFSNATKEIEDSIFKKKKGEDRYGRVRGYGIGSTPTQVFGIQAQLRNVENERHDPMKEEVQKLQAQMQDMQKKHESEMNEIKSLLHRLVGQSGNLGIETRESPSL